MELLRGGIQDMKALHEEVEEEWWWVRGGERDVMMVVVLVMPFLSDGWKGAYRLVVVTHTLLLPPPPPPLQVDRVPQRLQMVHQQMRALLIEFERWVVVVVVIVIASNINPTTPTTRSNPLIHPPSPLPLTTTTTPSRFIPEASEKISQIRGESSRFFELSENVESLLQVYMVL